MRIKVSEGFSKKLNSIVAYIAKDKPVAARKFKEELIAFLADLSHFALRNRASIYFDDESIRDAVFKGFVIVYRIDAEKQEILIFGLTRHEGNPES